MEARVTIEFDTETGDYEADLKNLDKPGESMDLEILSAILERIWEDLKRKAEGAGTA